MTIILSVCLWSGGASEAPMECSPSAGICWLGTVDFVLQIGKALGEIYFAAAFLGLSSAELEPWGPFSAVIEVI